jgi:hypothetical protein
MKLTGSERDPFQLIDPNLRGVKLQFQIMFEWDGQAHLQIANFQLSPEARLFLKNVFHNMAEKL